MRTLTEKLQTAVTDFIAQRDVTWLLIASAVTEAPLVFKLLGDCERSSRSEVFLLFGVPFVSAEQYAAAIVAQFVAEYQALAAARGAQQHAPLASLPEGIFAAPGPDVGPAQRIAAVLEAARALLPDDGVYRLVCAFWPLEVTDPVAYGQLLAALIALSKDSENRGSYGVPWKQSVRLIGFAMKGFPQPVYEQYVLRTDSDFSPTALMCSLHETIDDPQQPEAVRMHALFTLATVEQVHERVAAAITRYVQVLAYYQKQKNPSMQTIVLIQLGEAYQQQQRLPEARVCYEQALAPATVVPVPLCAARLARNLAEVALLQQRHAEAATGYQTWHRIAGQLGDHEGAARALTQLTVVQERLGRAAGRPQRSYGIEAQP